MATPFLNSIQSELAKRLTAFGVPENKSAKALHLAEDVISSKLSHHIYGGNIHGLMKMFEDTAPIYKNPIVEGITSEYTKQLVESVKVNKATAIAVAGYVIPLMMATISNRVNKNGADELHAFLKKDGTVKKVKSFGAELMRSFSFL